MHKKQRICKKNKSKEVFEECFALRKRTTEDLKRIRAENMIDSRVSESKARLSIVRIPVPMSGMSAIGSEQCLNVCNLNVFGQRIDRKAVIQTNKKRDTKEKRREFHMF